jgi:peptide-methionine (R)-S-oxide reductase
MKFLSIFLVLFACQQTPSNTASNASLSAAPEAKVQPDSLVPARYVDGKLVEMRKSEEEWKSQLNEMEFYVLRKEGTERSFTGDLWDNHEKGTYVCAGCGLPLFHSETKFDSGTGWPSFYQPITKDCIADFSDKSHGMDRTEVECARCGGHQGHVFPDGPPPTGLRYCINSVSLNFVKE